MAERYSLPSFGTDNPYPENTARHAAFEAGRASLAASAGTDCARCSGSGEDPEGFYDQSRGDAGHTHEGPCRSCGGSGVAASAGSEPVAWAIFAENGNIRMWSAKPDQVKTCATETGQKPVPLYANPSPRHGMVLVPREPTPEMLRAGDQKTWVLPSLDCWRAMLDAAPANHSPPEGMAGQALRQVLSVVQRYLPPDGPSAHDAMSEITAIVDPWPLGPLEKP